MLLQSQSQAVETPPTSFEASPFAGAHEPTLHELYEDPLLHAVLQCDGLPLDTLKDIVRQAQNRLFA